MVELQRLSRQYQQLQQRLTDFRERRIVRHHRRIEKYSLSLLDRLSTATEYTYSRLRQLSKRALELSDQYTQIAQRIFDENTIIDGIIYFIEQEQEGYILRIFSRRVKEARKELGITQTELAKKLGITQKNISYYEGGRSVPTLTNLFQLSLALKKPTDWLLGLS